MLYIELGIEWYFVHLSQNNYFAQSSYFISRVFVFTVDIWIFVVHFKKCFKFKPQLVEIKW
jgi:hypothetical protein